MAYVDKLNRWGARRAEIIEAVAAGKPRAVVARKFRITRQRVYQLTAHIRPNGSIAK